MRSHVVWVAVVGLMAVSASSVAQQLPLGDPNGFVSDVCTADRGLVKNGRIFGSPGAVAGARSITLLAFSKQVYRNVADPTRWPSKIAPTSLTTGEGILYRIDNLELRGFGSCSDAIGVEFGDFGGFHTTPEIVALFPAATCTRGAVKSGRGGATTIST